ncbi:UDP-glucose--hexose-1-phosphate uridylyltransferase [Aquibacillus kalidii]|uniref:UDP-glucose--hexose-1-phosphate uridylyltransferase n=1 Tax=Aquibacillus kalidii TaxID=2762597 RepID=UPI001644F52F|nr:UDP-glucose--hexose-1-phosphate uridylyltransferase [Aquibacillus kalidii]
MEIYSYISQIVDKGIQAELIEDNDSIYVRNQVLGLLSLNTYDDKPVAPTEKTMPDLLELLVDYAVQNCVIENAMDAKDILSSKIMNCFISKPSEINREFYRRYKASPEDATDYFYELSKNSNYIQMKQIKKNIHYKTETPFGPLDITINLSKPEKDPEQIKREREMKQTINYPKCLLCLENEGYIGRVGHPARSNHRVIEVPLEGEKWFLQYSPYVYYNEHSILFAEEHRDMKVDRGSFERLTAFTDQFPHYFIGSNADLPIVGGSILSHDHYQGGRYEFAMAKADNAFEFSLNNFLDVDASIVKWPMSVIRLNSKNRQSIIDAATFILDNWKNYSDKSVDIIAYSDETPHNTITPIARIRDGKYEMDLVLRNNRTTDQHPLGIFHPHEDVHHIKKENIGLIEVMGLAVLPPRLKTELDDIAAYLLDGKTKVADYHQEWVNQIKSDYKDSLHPENIDKIVKDELGKKFTKVLEDAGVFKLDDQGRHAFKAFIDSINE